MIHTPDAISGFASDGSGMDVVHDVMIHVPPPLTGFASQEPGKDGVPDSDHTEGGARSDIGNAVFISPFDQPVFPTPVHDQEGDGDDEQWVEHLDPKDFDHIVTVANLEAVDPLAAMVDSSGAAYSWELVANANAEYGPAFDPDNTNGDHRVWELSKIVCGFVKECDAEVIDALVQRHDCDTTLAVLGDQMLTWLAYRCDGLINVPNAAESFTMEHAFFAALELLALGIQHFHEAVHESLSGFPVNQVLQVYDAAQEQVQAAKMIREGRLIDKAYEVYWDHRIEFLSPTEEQEDDVDLAPAHKARIFMNALKERNDAGSLITTSQRDAQGTLIAIGLNYVPLLIYEKQDVAVLEAMFESYRNSSASDLLRILDACIRVHIDMLQGDTSRTKAFHAGKGRILAFFYKHLDTIISELTARYGYDYSRSLW